MKRFARRISACGAVAAALASSGAMANLVADSSFELLNGSWTASNWVIGAFGRGVHSGARSAATLCSDPGTQIAFSECTLSQTLTTTPGARYDISFWLYTDGFAPGDVGAFPNGLQVSFGGSAVDTILNFPSTNPSTTSLIPGGPSTLVTIENVLATSGSTLLRFGGFHNPAAIFVDDVTVEAAPAAAVPEPLSLSLVGLGLLGLAFARRRAS